MSAHYPPTGLEGRLGRDYRERRHPDGQAYALVKAAWVLKVMNET